MKEADRAAKKQKTCAGKSADAVASLQQQVARLRQQLQSPSSNGEAAAALINGLQRSLDKDKMVEQVSNSVKDLHNAVGRLGKALDKAFVADICKAPVTSLEMDQDQLDRIVAEHLFQQGRFEIGESFVAEATLSCEDTLKQPFAEMHSILKQIQARNLEPALQWVEEHRAELTEARQSYQNFEFQLHRLQFLRMLTQQGAMVALAYIRQHTTDFRESQAAKLTRLMGCLCYKNRLESSPYADLLAESQWDAIAQEFVRQCCGLMGLALESPLLVSVAAGSIALPTLLKLSDIMGAQHHELSFREQLPVEVELGKEFVFHSIFACPVSKDQSTTANPPMLLPCGHVLCQVSIQKIAKGSNRSFKCPYCPTETVPSACRVITFPDIRT